MPGFGEGRKEAGLVRNRKWAFYHMPAAVN